MILPSNLIATGFVSVPSLLCTSCSSCSCLTLVVVSPSSSSLIMTSCLQGLPRLLRGATGSSISSLFVVAVDVSLVSYSANFLGRPLRLLGGTSISVSLASTDNLAGEVIATAVGLPAVSGEDVNFFGKPARAGIFRLALPHILDGVAGLTLLSCNNHVLLFKVNIPG